MPVNHSNKTVTYPTESYSLYREKTKQQWKTKVDTEGTKCLVIFHDEDQHEGETKNQFGNTKTESKLKTQ